MNIKFVIIRSVEETDCVKETCIPFPIGSISLDGSSAFRRRLVLRVFPQLCLFIFVFVNGNTFHPCGYRHSQYHRPLWSSFRLFVISPRFDDESVAFRSGFR